MFLPLPTPSISINIYSTVLNLAKIECPPPALSWSCESQAIKDSSLQQRTRRGPPVLEARSQPGSTAQAQHLPPMGKKCRLLPRHWSKRLVALGRDVSMDRDFSVTPKMWPENPELPGALCWRRG